MRSMNNFLRNLVACAGLWSLSLAPAHAAPIDYILGGGLWYGYVDGTTANFAFDADSVLTLNSTDRTITMKGSATRTSTTGQTAQTGGVPGNIGFDLTYTDVTFLSDTIAVGINANLTNNLTANSSLGGLAPVTAKFLDPNFAPDRYKDYGTTPFSIVVDPGKLFSAWFMGSGIHALTGSSIGTVTGDFHGTLTRVSSVPEPGSAALLGIAALGGLVRRKKVSA